MSLFFACKENSDTIDPEITILSPSGDGNFNVFDTIHVLASVSDETAIESIKVALVNDHLTPVIYGFSYFPQSKSFTIDEQYIINDIHLESGMYFLMITAFDGVNTANGYVRLNITEVPMELQKIIILTDRQDDIDIYSVKNSTSAEYLYTVQGDYSASDISSRHQQLYFSGNYTINMQVYDLDGFAPLWSVEPMINPPFHLKRNIYSDESLVFVSFRNGFIRAYDGSGVIKFATPFSDVLSPARVFLHDDIVLADIAERSGYKRWVSAYYLVSGVLKGQVQSGIEVINFHYKDSDEAYVVGNTSAGGCIRLYNTATNNLSEPHTFTYGMIMSSVAVDHSNVIIGTENGIYWYRYDHNSLLQYGNASSAGSLLFDGLFSQLYVVHGLQIEIYGFPVPDLISTITMADTIRNAHLLYNK
ncbi:MAG: hypothetical protein NT175_01030 [Bacteroidetes bacterium]|nr:hypothetical protein [Bacteroidota bacterium]